MTNQFHFLLLLFYIFYYIIIYRRWWWGSGGVGGGEDYYYIITIIKININKSFQNELTYITYIVQIIKYKQSA